MQARDTEIQALNSIQRDLETQIGLAKQRASDVQTENEQISEENHTLTSQLQCAKQREIKLRPREETNWRRITELTQERDDLKLQLQSAKKTCAAAGSEKEQTSCSSRKLRMGRDALKSQL
ncbi:unnamed protein product [Effrenium voratum]|uniref:Uncharacterized protein n=1 Tax=Effrenium voratum TaxID=2562239 RepID=A0AA36JDL9_9DINO|nr:unnamed protein product [Effrenium voratum]CAJ1432787.1 unnamed protein product [Effrenium voratum]